jgi:hypothetical protein
MCPPSTEVMCVLCPPDVIARAVKQLHTRKSCQAAAYTEASQHICSDFVCLVLV